MSTISEFAGLATPIEDTQDTEIEIDMNDDDLQFDDFELEEGEPEIDAATASPATVPGWRRIEMFRENRLLRSELADFEDYDSFDPNAAPGSAAFAP